MLPLERRMLQRDMGRQEKINEEAGGDGKSRCQKKLAISP
jgi:hypothetical protein